MSNQIPHNCIIGNQKSNTALIVLGGNIFGYEDYSKYFCVIGSCMTKQGAQKILAFIKTNNIKYIFVAGKDTPFKIKNILIKGGAISFKGSLLSLIKYNRLDAIKIIHTKIQTAKKQPKKMDALSFHIIPAKDLFEITVLEGETVLDSFICSASEALYKISKYTICQSNFEWCQKQLFGKKKIAFSSLQEIVTFYCKKILKEGRRYKDERGNTIKELPVFFKINYNNKPGEINSITKKYIKQVNGEIPANKFSYNEFDLIKYQINPLLKILKFKETRRAFLLFAREKDVEAQLHGVERPCPHVIYFRIVNGKLNYTVVMRSNDLLKCFIPDFLAFYNLIKKRIASRLKLKIGEIQWFANSLHIYEDI